MYQTIIIVGNVGRDPEMRYTPSGQAVTSFSVATNRQYTNNNGETVKETIWFRVSAWGKTGRDLQPISQERFESAGGRPPDRRPRHRRTARLDRAGRLAACLLRSFRRDGAFPELTQRYRRRRHGQRSRLQMKAQHRPTKKISRSNPKARTKWPSPLPNRRHLPDRDPRRTCSRSTPTWRASPTPRRSLCWILHGSCPAMARRS